MWLPVEHAAALDIGEISKFLKVDKEVGLWPEEVHRRRVVFGPNELNSEKKDRICLKYIEQFKNPLILLLLGSATVSACMGQLDDAVSITVAIIIVVTVAFIQEYRSERSLEELNKLVPPTCLSLRDGKIQTLLARDLVPGDVVHLNVGSRVPADMRLFEASDLTIDESSFTGETEPAQKSVMPVLKSDQNNLKRNIAFMGTLVRCGHGKGIVINTGIRSEFGQVFAIMLTEESPKTPLQKSMDILGAQLSFCSFLVIGFILLLGWIQGRVIKEMFTIGVSLAVAAIPEGLPIVVTVTLALGVIRMAKRKAIVKKLPTVETLSCVNVICSDKTGTLTANEMTVTVIVSSEGYVADVSGIGYNAMGEIKLRDCDNRKVAQTAIHTIVEVGCVCNNAVIRDDVLYGQPTEGALIALGLKNGMSDISKTYLRLQEYPFTCEQKMMAVKCIRKDDEHQQEIYFMKGALERILSQCTRYSVDGQSYELTRKQREVLLSEAYHIGQQGLRVIGLASGLSLQDLTYHGLVGICDPPKLHVRGSVSSLMAIGVEIKIVTGDSRETAGSIGQMIGLDIDISKMMSGNEIDRVSADEFRDKCGQVNIFYRVDPKHKAMIVKALQDGGYIVGMTGDGVNDGIALKRADIGIAMGVNGTDVCKEAADMILVDDDFQTLIAAIEEGKGIFHNIQNFVKFQLSTSIAALFLIAFATIRGTPNPLNAMQLLWINIIMDGPPAQSLGVEPVSKDVLKQRPRDVREPIITRYLITNVMISSSLIIFGTLWIHEREMMSGGTTPRHTTMTFTCFVFFDLFNAFNCRSQTRSIFSIGLLSNKVFIVAVLSSLIGQMLVIYWAPLQGIFQTESLSGEDLILLFILTSTVLIFGELAKMIGSLRRLQRISVLHLNRKVKTNLV